MNCENKVQAGRCSNSGRSSADSGVSVNGPSPPNTRGAAEAVPRRLEVAVTSVLVVHGTGGPRRDPCSLRLEWVTSLQDGLALAGATPPEAPDVAIVDVDGRAEHSGEPPLTEREAEVLERW